MTDPTPERVQKDCTATVYINGQPAPCWLLADAGLRCLHEATITPPSADYWSEDGEHTVGDDVATVLAAWDELAATTPPSDTPT